MEEKKIMRKYTFVGCLSNGEAIFDERGKGISIEKDHIFLTETTPEERAEAYQRYPFLDRSTPGGGYPKRTPQEQHDLDETVRRTSGGTGE